MNSYTELWSGVCDMMKERDYITIIGFDVFFRDSYIYDYKDRTVYLSIPNPDFAEMISKTYHEKLKVCFAEFFGFPVEVDYVVNSDETLGIDDIIQPEVVTPIVEGMEYTFDNFVLGSSNRYAQAAALSVAENPSIYYNPLLIYGASGVGKTHLMFSIKNRIHQLYPKKKIEYLRCEDFANRFYESMQSGTMNLFHNRFRSVDVLLIDDIQFLEKKIQLQEEIFNTFETLLRTKKQIVITSDRPPKDINELDIRLISRFENGLIADIAAPDLETRIGIVKIKSRAVGVNLDDDKVFYIADQVKMNARQLEGIINQMKAYLQLHKENPSVPIIQSYIRNMMSEVTPDPLTLDKIISEVSRYYHISELDIRSKKRMADIVWARHVSIYITHKITSISNIQISKELKMNHTSVAHALKNVENRLAVDTFAKRQVEEITDTLKHFA